MVALIKKEYDVTAIKQKAIKLRKEAEDWLIKNNKNKTLANSFIVRVSLGEVEAMIANIESLTEMLTDDFK